MKLKNILKTVAETRYDIIANEKDENGEDIFSTYQMYMTEQQRKTCYDLPESNDFICLNPCDIPERILNMRLRFITVGINHGKKILEIHVI